PLIKTPFHLSYLIYLGCYSRALAKEYFRWALRLCCVTGTAPSLLLHPLDFLGCDDTRDLDFFPAMKQESSRKLELVHQLFDIFTTRFAYVTRYYLQYPALGFLVWPPFFYLVEGAFMLVAGTSYLAAQILIGLFLFLACVYLFRLVTMTHDRTHAAFTVLLFGLSPLVFT